MSNKIKFLIVASVLLNVLLAGVIVGSEMRRFGTPPEPREVVMKKLPEERQKEFKTALKKLKNSGKDLNDDIKENREKTIKIISAPTFDKEAYQAKVDEFHELMGKRKQLMADVVKDLASKWSPEERVVLGELLRRPPPRPLGDLLGGPPPGPAPNGSPPAPPGDRDAPPPQ